MTCLPVAGQLPASKTHRDRRWAFVANTDTTLPGLGVLTIVQGRRDADSYAVDVDANESQVLLAKLDAAADVYGVTCDRAGRPVRCNCPGFAFKKTCKHADAVRELRADGLLPNPNPCG